jgi:hypothetical protein
MADKGQVLCIFWIDLSPFIRPPPDTLRDRLVAPLARGDQVLRWFVANVIADLVLSLRVFCLSAGLAGVPVALQRSHPVDCMVVSASIVTPQTKGRPLTRHRRLMRTAPFCSNSFYQAVHVGLLVALDDAASQGICHAVIIAPNSRRCKSHSPVMLGFCWRTPEEHAQTQADSAQASLAQHQLDLRCSPPGCGVGVAGCAGRTSDASHL